jgi:hypothetical protein
MACKDCGLTYCPGGDECYCRGSTKKQLAKELMDALEDGLPECRRKPVYRPMNPIERMLIARYGVRRVRSA